MIHKLKALYWMEKNKSRGERVPHVLYIQMLGNYMCLDKQRLKWNNILKLKSAKRPIALKRDKISLHICMFTNLYIYKKNNFTKLEFFFYLPANKKKQRKLKTRTKPPICRTKLCEEDEN